jgi:hypothetical protein
MKESNTSEY